MTWFKVDDGFYDHPKVDTLSNAAVGLWTKAGSWCGKHETDGVIPASRVRALKGTASQIRALIEAGLWGETTTDSGAKAYAFRDWFDYQPSREQREKERREWAERKRKSREQKEREQQESENVTGGVTRKSRAGHSGGVTQMSGTSPDPTRPDPSIREGVEVGGQVQTAREDDGSPPRSLDELAAAHAAEPTAPPAGDSPADWSTADDPRCRKHAHLDRDEVPACRACGAAREWFEDQADRSKSARRQAIQDCEWCDDRGLIDTHTPNGDPRVLKCDHQGPPPPDPAPAEEFQPFSDPQARARLLGGLGGGPF